ncbi:MAG: hypothetical protein WKF61_07560 [Luteimonas sp.]
MRVECVGVACCVRSDWRHTTKTKPIYREGIDPWRHYERWLGPLKDALGPVLQAYPGVPEFETDR